MIASSAYVPGGVCETMIFELDQTCFSGSYQEARARLVHEIAALPDGLLQDHQSFAHPLAGPDGQALSMDCYLLSQTDTPDNILVLISATHGVEGFAGSAIQSCHLGFLAEQVQADASLGVLIIHALNPWGFAWLRRYDHEGIDLNRNFIDFSAPLPANELYALVHDNLFTDTSQDIRKVLTNVRTEWGEEVFEDIITRGQYQFPQGLFYGGRHESWSRKMLTGLSKSDYLQNARRIGVVDLHTGLGPYGHGEVINDHEPGTSGFKHASDWYGVHAQSALLGEACSPPKTGLLDYFWHKLIADRGCFVTLEYGSYSLDQLLMRLCEEQRFYNEVLQSGSERDIEHATVSALRDFFYPRDSVWQELVLFRARQIIKLALRGVLN